MDQTVIHSTFTIERHYPVPPERVFAAFADSQQKRRWFVEGDHHNVEHYQQDFRVGGREQAEFRFKEGTPLNGIVCRNDTLYQDIVPNRRIVFSSAMAIGGKCISVSLATVELLPKQAETDLLFTHQGAFFEGSDGPVIREAGWRKLFERLTDEWHR